LRWNPTALSKVDWLVWMRRIGNLSIVAGYFILLNVDLLTGVLIRICANALVLPWGVRAKLWDFVALVSFLMAIELHKLIVMLIL
jgi:hypothetical protein